MIIKPFIYVYLQVIKKWYSFESKTNGFSRQFKIFCLNFVHFWSWNFFKHNYVLMFHLHLILNQNFCYTTTQSSYKVYIKKSLNFPTVIKSWYIFCTNSMVYGIMKAKNRWTTNRPELSQNLKLNARLLRSCKNTSNGGNWVSFPYTPVVVFNPNCISYNPQ